LTHYEQSVIDREDAAHGSSVSWGDGLGGSHAAPRRVGADPSDGERAARVSLRAQIARLEREHSALLAERFPYISAPPALAAPFLAEGPSLLDLGGLERSRDALAGRLQELRARVAERTEHERRAREQLRMMRLEPGRYKFARVQVRDLGQGVCGVWEVRPRLGLIGMLAGWWQLKLSSGCPLPKGSCPRHDPGPLRSASPPAFDADGRSSSRRSSSRTWVPG
jgi:hypothetical protein